MNKPKSILVVADFDSDADKVVDRAIIVARQFHCELDIVYCNNQNIGMSDSISLLNESVVLRRHIRQVQEDFVESLAEQANIAGVSASGSVLEQRPAGDAILARAKETNPCLVMKGTEFHSEAQRSVLVDTDWQLIRSCPYPLWLVKKDDFAESPVVLAAVDPMHENDKPAELDRVIVDTAKAIASPSNGAVLLLHTYERLSAIGKAASRAIGPISLPIKEIDQRIKTEHREALDALADASGIDAEFAHQLPGRTRDLLPAFVRSNKVDLVVMGSLARWSLKRMVIGSTAERVLDHLRCDVLIVRNNENQFQTLVDQPIEAATG